MSPQIIQILIGIALIVVAFIIIKKVAKTIFFLLILAGGYCFSHGLIELEPFIEWISNIFH